jgi:hypothetical protein
VGRGEGGSGNTVVAAAHLHRLLLQQVLDPCLV